MNEELLAKLLEYIDARIAETSVAVRESSDGGPIESLQTSDIRDELYALVLNQNRTP